MEEHIQGPVGGLTVQRVELLVREILEARHEGIAQQIAESKQMLGKPMGIGHMLPRPENRRVNRTKVRKVSQLFKCHV